MLLTEIIAAKDLARGALKETPFYILDMLHVIAQVSKPEVCKTLFCLVVLLPLLLILICLPNSFSQGLARIDRSWSVVVYVVGVSDMDP